jgi:PGF-pre-PGF domain-containing protein
MYRMHHVFMEKKNIGRISLLPTLLISIFAAFFVAILLLASSSEAAIIATSNGTISIDASSGSISQGVQGNSNTGSNSISITFNDPPSAPSNNSNSTGGNNPGGGNFTLDTPAVANQNVSLPQNQLSLFAESSITVNFSQLTKDQKIDQAISEDGMPIIKISFIPLVDRANVSFTIKTLSSKPFSTENLLNPTYAYIEITKTNIQNSEIINSSVSFKVLTSWIKMQKISNAEIILKRFTLAWDDQPTKFVQELQGSAFYESSLPGFSYFAIVAKRAGSSLITGEVVSNKTDTGLQLVKKNSTGISSIDFSSTPVKISSWIVVLIVVGAIGFMSFKKLSAAGIFEDYFPAKLPAQQPVQGQDVQQLQQTRQPNQFQPGRPFKPSPQYAQQPSGTASQNDVQQKLRSLQEFIAEQRSMNIPEDKIKQSLLQVGWQPDIVDFVLSKPMILQQQAQQPSQQPQQSSKPVKQQAAKAQQSQAVQPAAQPTAKQAPRVKVPDTLVDYAKSCYQKGYSGVQIRMALQQAGWTPAQIDSALDKALSLKNSNDIAG